MSQSQPRPGGASKRWIPRDSDLASVPQGRAVKRWTALDNSIPAGVGCSCDRVQEAADTEENLPGPTPTEGEHLPVAVKMTRGSASKAADPAPQATPPGKAAPAAADDFSDLDAPAGGDGPGDDFADLGLDTKTVREQVLAGEGPAADTAWAEAARGIADRIEEFRAEVKAESAAGNQLMRDLIGVIRALDDRLEKAEKAIASQAQTLAGFIHALPAGGRSHAAPSAENGAASEDESRILAVIDALKKQSPGREIPLGPFVQRLIEKGHASDADTALAVLKKAGVVKGNTVRI